MFDLTQQIADHQRAKAQYHFLIAARLIAQCPDETKRWRAMHELRKLQKMARGG